MKKLSLVLLNILFLVTGCKTYKTLDAENIAAVYLTVLPYTVSPFSINEVNIHFIEESTCSQLRIHGQYIEQIADRLSQLKLIKYNSYPTKYLKYTKVWIGLQLVNEKKRFSIGIAHDGVIKIGNHFYEKDDLLLSIIFQQKIHPRIIETIPRDSVWGKFLLNK